MEMLGKLDEKLDEGNYRILVATDLECMRGIDYRSRRYGITLFVLK